MNTFRKFQISVLLATVGIMSACTSESPFTTGGEGTLRLSVGVNSRITRAVITDEETLQDLLDKCVIYISDEEGLLHKWQGVGNVPDQISLKYGAYVAEAWSGDSVTASFDNRFYKGMTRFEISESVPVVNASINCKLANVVGSVDYESVDLTALNGLTVTFSNTRGELEMKGETLMEKAYFMMPDGDTSLSYKVSYQSLDGTTEEISDVITDVKTGHEYRLSFNAEKNQSGGAFFDIIVKEYEDAEEEDLTIYGKPSFSWENNTLSIGGQIINTLGNFITERLRIGAYNGGFKSLKLIPDANIKGYLGSYTEYDLVNISSSVSDELGKNGVTLEKGHSSTYDGLHIWTLTFDSNFFNKLESRNEEYVLTITAVDGKDKTETMKVRIANTEAAIKYDDPIIVNDPNFATNDLTSVTATSITIPVTIVDPSKYLGLQYKKESDSTWQIENVNGTRAGNEVKNITLTGLTPNCKYVYRLVAGTETDGKFEFESDEYSFATEEKFIIPNSSMEDWSEYSENNKIIIPAANGIRVFWDSGNHGSVKANTILTNKSDELKNTGNFSARLESKYANILGIGKFAAGNLFIGEYVKTDGTDGVLSFGREYNGSHPKALRVYANYRPQPVKSNASKNNYLTTGQSDQGQIYIALSTSPIEIRTKSSNQKLFNENDKEILAYGQVTFTQDFGDDNVLEKIDIPLTYNERGKTTEAKYLIIVCSASKYGDFFCGGEGSIMYLDDFELIYE